MSNSTRKLARNGIPFGIGLFQMAGFTMASLRRKYTKARGMVYKVCSLRRDDFQQSTNSFIAWAKKGIVGRGVLIDFYSYALRNKIDYTPWSFYKIPASVIQNIAREHEIQFQEGDILLLRTGNVEVTIPRCLSN